MLAESDPDGALVERSQAGDDQALRALYQRHRVRLYTMAVRLTGNRSDAEDIVQETFVKAWRSLSAFRGEASFGTWLYRIALNLCRDLHRRRRPTEPEAEVATPPVSTDGIARRRLAQALSELSHGYREVLVLHDVMELNHGEIAEILGVDIGTSKSQLHKARSKMRTHMAAPVVGVSP
jgi:RNA polymerase sigma-70 factor (ECF subfamily)